MGVKGVSNLFHFTMMGQTLFDLLNGWNLKLYEATDLREQALSTVAVESPRGGQIAKKKASKKIDGIIALSLACVSEIEKGRPPEDDIYLGPHREVKVETDFDPRFPI